MRCREADPRERRQRLLLRTRQQQHHLGSSRGKKPYRTPQTPMERAAAEEVFKIDRITGMRWAQGSRQYHILWEGYAEKDSTCCSNVLWPVV